MPETSFVTIEDDRAPPGSRFTHFTLLRDSAHSNVDHLFNEDNRRVAEEDQLVAVPRILGAYPHALFRVTKSEVGARPSLKRQP